MIDFGFDKIALIGAVALIVIGPERLPRVARTVGHLMGKAQRYVADVKAEVSGARWHRQTPRTNSPEPKRPSSRTWSSCAIG
jgi:Sec-independent protein translocase protein TatA